jgi:hypothetical protein
MALQPLSDTQKERIARDLEGTFSSGDLQVEEYGRPMSEIIEAAAENGIVRCVGCDYWGRVNRHGECVECASC